MNALNVELDVLKVNNKGTVTTLFVFVGVPLLTHLNKYSANGSNVFPLPLSAAISTRRIILHNCLRYTNVDLKICHYLRLYMKIIFKKSANFTGK